MLYDKKVVIMDVLIRNRGEERKKRQIKEKNPENIASKYVL